MAGITGITAIAQTVISNPNFKSSVDGSVEVIRNPDGSINMRLYMIPDGSCWCNNIAQKMVCPWEHTMPDDKGRCKCASIIIPPEKPGCKRKITITGFCMSLGNFGFTTVDL